MAIKGKNETGSTDRSDQPVRRPGYGYGPGGYGYDPQKGKKWGTRAVVSLAAGGLAAALALQSTGTPEHIPRTAPVGVSPNQDTSKESAADQVAVESFISTVAAGKDSSEGLKVFLPETNNGVIFEQGEDGEPYPVYGAYLVKARGTDDDYIFYAKQGLRPSINDLNEAEVSLDFNFRQISASDLGLKDSNVSQALWNEEEGYFGLLGSPIGEAPSPYIDYQKPTEEIN